MHQLRVVASLPEELGATSKMMPMMTFTVKEKFKSGYSKKWVEPMNTGCHV